MNESTVTWSDPTYAMLVEIAPVLTEQVARVADADVHASLIIERNSLFLYFDGITPDGGYVYIEAGTYGDLYVGPEPGSSRAERYNVEQPAWNPGEVDWLECLPQKIAAVLTGKEWL